MPYTSGADYSNANGLLSEKARIALIHGEDRMVFSSESRSTPNRFSLASTNRGGRAVHRNVKQQNLVTKKAGQGSQIESEPFPRGPGTSSIVTSATKKKHVKGKHSKQMSLLQPKLQAPNQGQFQIYTSASSVQDLKARAKRNQNMMQVYAGGASVVLETNQGAFYLDDHSKTIKPKKSGVRINKHMQRQATRKAAIARVNLSEVNSQGKAYTAQIHQHARNHPLTTTIKSAW